MKRQRRKEKLRLRAPQIMVLGFLSVIIIGALLLLLPFMTYDGITFTDAFFTSVSAVCVTGLVTVDIAAAFTVGGQIVIMLLIQIGGLGFITMVTLAFLMIRKRIKLSDRMAIQESLNEETGNSVVKIVRNIVLGTFIIEAAGFALLLPFFVMQFGGTGAWKALFTAVSAFCNCGMDLMGDTGASFISLLDTSVGAYAGAVIVLLSASFLTILGGLGFGVIFDLIKQKRFRKTRLYTKIAVITTVILLLLGFAVFFAAEFANPDTLGGMGFGEKVLYGWLLTVFPRSAGFAGVPVPALRPVSRAFLMLLMFIGASPVSTGGGIKTTTAAVLVLGAYSGMRGHDGIVAGKRTVPHGALYRSLSVLLLAVSFVFAGSLLLLATESGSAVAQNGLFTFENIVFEAIGAFSLAGMSMGVTPYLSVAGKYIAAILMFCGRLGPIALGLVFMKQQRHAVLTYPDAHIVVG